MKKILKNIAVTLIILASSFALNPINAYAVASGSSSAVCDGAGVECNDIEAATVSTTIRRAIRLFQVIAGLLSVFYLIYAGIKFITSSGGSDGIKTARNTILYVAVGIIVVLISEGIIRFVIVRFN